MENLLDIRSQRQAGVATSHRMLMYRIQNTVDLNIEREANNDSSMGVSVNEIS